MESDKEVLYCRAGKTGDPSIPLVRTVRNGCVDLRRLQLGRVEHSPEDFRIFRL